MKLINVDFAVNDPRSVAAMLRGNGDRRVMLFRLFRLIEIRRDPEISEDGLAEIWNNNSEEYARMYSRISFLAAMIRNMIVGAALVYILVSALVF